MKSGLLKFFYYFYNFFLARLVTTATLALAIGLLAGLVTTAALALAINRLARLPANVHSGRTAMLKHHFLILLLQCGAFDISLVVGLDCKHDSLDKE